MQTSQRYPRQITIQPPEPALRWDLDKIAHALNGQRRQGENPQGRQPGQTYAVAASPAGDLSTELHPAVEQHLREAFGAFGEVTSVNVISDKFTGQSKGFGFVEMSDNSAADAAIKALNETAMGGRNLKVNEARPREQRPSGGSRW